MTTVLVLNGPNLNLLGTREPDVYGHQTLADLESELVGLARQRGANLTFFQSNHEGALIDRIHLARTDGTDFVIINAGAFSHTSIALRDALAAVSLRFIEVHLTNTFRRESFRHHSHLAGLATGVVVGLGVSGYRYALDYALSGRH